MIDNKNSIVGHLRDYFLKCPFLYGNKINVDYLGNESVEYSIEPVPATIYVEKYQDGSGIKQFVFVLASRNTYGADVVQNMINSKFYEDLSEWIEVQSEDENLPKVKGIESIECLTNGYAFQTGLTSARYQIQLRITYYSEKKGVI